jgi:dihydrofolate reductase
MRKLCLYIACSLDGYIAQPNDDLSFLKIVEKDGEDYGYAKFIATIDTYIIGRKTYEWVKNNIGTSHYDNGERDVYVMTRSERPTKGKTVFYTGDLNELVHKLKAQEGKNIYCDGGAEIINALLKDNLVDEITVSIIPILLSQGTRLFQDKPHVQQLNLVKCESFETGLVQLYYTCKK